MTTENRGDEQRYESTVGARPEAAAAGTYGVGTGDSPAGSGTAPHGGAYPSAGEGSYASGPAQGAPNPGLAALLGFIPGVGAMYNGQFPKGLAHIAIFAVFCSLSNNVNGIFGLFVAGWVLYMAFEAYQTAVARRNGFPLPDPFGLNHIGERFGFRASPNFNSLWGQGPPPADRAAQPGPYPQPGYQPPPFHVDPSGTVYRSTAAPVSSEPMEAQFAHTPHESANYGAVPPAAGTPYGSTVYDATPYGAPPIPPMPPPQAGESKLPAGALWLIGLGLFALLGSVRAFDFLEGESTGGIFLIGLSLFLLWRRWNQSRLLYPAGSPAARWTVVQGARGTAVLFVVGLLTLLQGLRIVYWESSWPLLLIALGLLLLLERFAVDRITTAAAYAAPQPIAQTEPSAPVTSILPRYTHADDDTTRREGQQL